MPQRFLRPGITDSERFNSVDWQCQSFFVRLLTVVDDYGRYDGRPSVIVGHAFSVWNDINPEAAIDTDMCRELCKKLVAAKLILLYEVAGKPYLQMLTWKERVRTPSKYPNPPENQNDSTLTAQCTQDAVTLLSRCTLPSPSPAPAPQMQTPTGKRLIPKSVEEVKFWATTIGCPEDQAERFWHHFEASGWIDKNGNPIMNARSKLCTWKTDGQSWKHEAKINGKVVLKPESSNFWENQKRLEIVDKEIREIKERASQTALDLVIMPQDQARYRQLLTERKRLKREINPHIK